MNATRPAPECPICRRPIDRGLKEHLYDHSKSDLVGRVLAIVEEDEEDEE